jgi:hypothetical protein
MSSVSLFTTSDLYSTTATTSSTQKNAETEAATTSQTSDQEDTVKISTAAQAKLLYKEGQGVSTIAATLGTDAKTINDDLGLTLEKTIEKTLESTVSAKA